MVRNKMTDLNNHLFEQLERLNDELTEEELEQELKRSKALANVSRAIIDNTRLALDAEKFKYNAGMYDGKMPPMLESGMDEKE